LPQLLDRDLARAQVRELIDAAVPLLQEVVNYGTNVYQRCNQEVRSGSGEYNIAVLSLYLHQLEMADAIEVLIGSAAPGAARPQLRSSLEAVLSLEYLLERDTEQRGRAWLVAHVHRRIAELTGFAKRASAQQLAAINKSLGDNRKLLQNPDWVVLDADYAALKKKKGCRPAWYELGGGPGNLRDLASRLRHEHEYDQLYRQWSSVVHADDLPGQLVALAGGKMGVRRLRDPKHFSIVVGLAVGFALRATRLMLTQYRREEIDNGVLARWYLSDVRAVWRRFAPGAPADVP
jgi:hypothetical protein